MDEVNTFVDVELETMGISKRNLVQSDNEMREMSFKY